MKNYKLAVLAVSDRCSYYIIIMLYMFYLNKAAQDNDLRSK